MDIQKRPRVIIHGQGGMDFKNTKDEYDDIRDYCDFEKSDVERGVVMSNH